MRSFYNGPAHVYCQIVKNIRIQYPRVLKKVLLHFQVEDRKMRVPTEELIYHPLQKNTHEISLGILL